MLVLSRKANEGITIGTGPDAVRVEVVEIERGKVRLGITAPREVKVLRDELMPTESTENQKCSK